MPSVVPAAGQTYIPDDADQAAARDQHAITVAPNSVQLVVERLVVGYVPKLTRVVVVLLQCPVGRGCDDEMN